MEAVACIDEAGRANVSGVSTPVPWWSFGKTALAICALRLVEQGRLALDAPVEGASYSLAQLLGHEAGLPDYGGVARYHADVVAGKPPWPVARLLQAVEADRLRFPPGEGWAYSNIGYLKVAQLIERASGLALGEALGRLVFEPVGLASARLALTPQDLAGVCMGGAPDYHPGWVYHGLVVGTVEDAARLLHALLGGALLRDEAMARMVQGRLLAEHRSAVHPDPAYGLGLMHWARDPLDHPLGHGGAGPGSKIAVYGLGRRVCAIWDASADEGDQVVERVFATLREMPATDRADEPAPRP